jgi:hypothetical protein
MKSKVIFSLITIVLSIVVVFVALSTPHNSSGAKASGLYKEKSATPTPLPTVVSGVSALAIQKYSQGSQVITQQKNGFDISIANFRYENEEIKAEVCFQLPNNADWRIWDATMQFGGTDLLLSTIAPREMTETLANGKRQVTTYSQGVSWQEIPHDGQPDYLCETLAFFSPTAGTDLTKLDLTQAKLIIQSIGALPREGEECSFYLDIVQSRLDAKGIGIKLDCVSQDGGAQVVIARKPANMSRNDAEMLVSRESVESFIVQGPWIFPSPSQ